MDIEPYRKGLLIRGVEQRLLKLFGENRLFGTVHTCIGQEFSAVALAQALGPGDVVFSNHRCHGHFLARTGDVDGLIAEIMGKRTGVCGGRGGSQHLHAPGFYSNGVLGGTVPVAAGFALSMKLRKQDGIVAAFIGDGTLGEGVLYESLNIASKWELPLLLILENNGYAQSTPSSQTLAGDICARAAAFGIETARADTWAFGELFEKAAEAAERVRRRRRPFFLQIDTYRLMAHSKGDDSRDPAEVRVRWAKDPLQLFVQNEPAQAEQIQVAVGRQIDAAVAKADSAPYAASADGDEDPPGYAPRTWRPAAPGGRDKVAEALFESFQRNMRRDERIVMIGEDIEAPYGGAFKVTRQLSREFPARVRNTPVSEAGIVGAGNGLALAGMIAVVEIMFGDFLALAADQIVNHASKFGYMYNGKVFPRLIVRTPMGGRRGYGPTHSQSLEKHFAGLPGTRMLAINSWYDPGRVYDALFEGIDRPTIVIENKLLYGAAIAQRPPEGFALEHSDEPFPTTRLRALSKPDLTILCYGGMMSEAAAAAERLFEEHEIACEIVCPTQLYPLNAWPIVESARATGRLLVVEEGIGFAALGAEAVAQVCELAPGALRRVRRLASPRHPIPSCGPLEKALLPNAERIVERSLEVIHGH